MGPCGGWNCVTEMGGSLAVGGSAPFRGDLSLDATCHITVGD